MPTNWLGIDLPQITTQAQNVLNMRERGQTQQHINKAYAQREASQPMIGKMLAGDDDAASALQQSDPQAWMQTRTAMAQMDQAQRDAIQANMQTAVVGLGAIESAPPEQQQQRYAQLRALQPPSIQKIMPEQYSPEAGQQMMREARGFAGLVKDADREAAFNDAKALAGYKSGLKMGEQAQLSKLKMGEQSHKAQLDAVAKKTGMSPKTILETRKQAAGEMKSAIDGLHAAQKVVATLSVPGAITDVATIFSAMKSLDPASVVRESEFDTMTQASGLYEGLKGTIQKAKGEGFITDKTRQNMAVMVRKLADLYMKNANKTSTYWKGFSERAGVKPEHVLGGLVPENPSSGPLAAKPPIQAPAGAMDFLPAGRGG